MLMCAAVQPAWPLWPCFLHCWALEGPWSGSSSTRTWSAPAAGFHVSNPTLSGMASKPAGGSSGKMLVGGS
jgi:hypothetical protein